MSWRNIVRIVSVLGLWAIVLGSLPNGADARELVGPRTAWAQPDEGGNDADVASFATLPPRLGAVILIAMQAQLRLQPDLRRERAAAPRLAPFERARALLL